MTKSTHTNDENKDSLQRVKGKWPPRLLAVEIAGIPGHYDAMAKGTNGIFKDEFYSEWVHITEHEAILGERINEGYEWTRKQLNEYESLVAGKDKLIKDLEAAMAEKDKEIAELKEALEVYATKYGKEAIKFDDLQSRLAVARETLGKIGVWTHSIAGGPEYTRAELGVLVNEALAALSEKPGEGREK